MKLQSQEPTVVDGMRSAPTTSYAFPLYIAAVSAGHPSPKKDDVEGKIDLNRHLIKNPATTLLVRVSGDSMIGTGIHSGDVLVVDRSQEPTQDRIVIAVIDGELTVKRICHERKRLYLMLENPNYPPLLMDQGMEQQVWGFVTKVIHPV